ncbi:hypothetical protein [Fibrobacter succinogenes]|uniref:hypothetical protein n=1 Tax=Fibrobacter succinogenes TaxID=833 RepID=UPI00215B4854|nr:hypothetical protein [Fibrobacter succinogenes]
MFTSAAIILWACGEGSINYVEDQDEIALKELKDKLDTSKKDYDENVNSFLQTFVDYCNSKEGHKAGCELEKIKKSSSSKKEENKSSSSSKTSNSSSSTSANSSSSKGGTTSSSSVKGSSSSSSATSASSSSVSSSSSKPLPVSGKCILDRPEKVYIGDVVTWSYLPDEGSLEKGNFVWEVSEEVEKGLVEGKLSGNGTPSIKVKYSSVGQKFGPELTFAGKEVRCDDDFRVYQVVVEESSSSEEESSSSSEPESSSSSKAVVKGYCAVSKRVITVGETVEWFIVDADRQELEGRHQWIGYGDGTAQYVSGEEKGTGSTRVVVQYLQPGDKAPQVTWDGKTVTCERDELSEDDFDPLLRVEALPESSSSEEPPEESSSSSGETDSSSSSYKKPVDCVLEPDDPACTSYDF